VQKLTEPIAEKQRLNTDLLITDLLIRCRPFAIDASAGKWRSTPFGRHFQGAFQGTGNPGLKPVKTLG
jgi:hypothetical protein